MLPKCYYTKLPNTLVDEWMPIMSPSEYKIVIFIVRKTYGFHKEADTISLSQFVEGTGLARNTVKDAINRLIERGCVGRTRRGNSYLYSILTEGKSNILTDLSNRILGSNNKPKRGQYLPPQKKSLKRKERNTNRDLNIPDSRKIIDTWTSLLGDISHIPESKLNNLLFVALDHFDANYIIEAIKNRAYSSYYREKKPELRSNPNAFFPYPETIRTDHERRKDNLYTYYDILRICTDERKYKMDRFELVEEIKDDKNRPMWRFKNLN